MRRYILSIDQGTSGTKALLFDDEGRFVHRCNAEHQQYYPQPGWVEHDAMEIFNDTVNTIDALIEETGINPANINALSITNQRETVVVWDKTTGEPIHNAIVWQCNRSSDICDRISSNGYSEVIHSKTGLILSPYYSASKITWILENVPFAREKADNGDLLFGTIDSWLIYKFTRGKTHATDCSNASRTQLMNIDELCWDDEIMSLFDIPKSMAPEICASDHIYGRMQVSSLANYNIPITGVLGDSHAALFGQNCYNRGMAKVTYGTGSSIMMNIGKKSYLSKKGLVTSVGWQVGGETVYVAEGNINCSAATIKWIVDDLELLPDANSSEEVASSVPDNGGVYLVPAFVGLGTPYWDSEATALITGITRGTKKAHIVRAALESMAYQVKDILDIMTIEAYVPLGDIRVDGGPSRNNFFIQFQSDLLNTKIIVNQVEEICALGSAYVAGLSTKLWKDYNELIALRTNDTNFTSKIDDSTRESLYSNWKKAVSRTLAKF